MRQRRENLLPKEDEELPKGEEKELHKDVFGEIVISGALTAATDGESEGGEFEINCTIVNFHYIRNQMNICSLFRYRIVLIAFESKFSY